MDTVCAWDGLYMRQPDGTIEPGVWIGDKWYCAECLADLTAQRWLADDWYLMVDTEPELADYLMENTYD